MSLTFEGDGTITGIDTDASNLLSEFGGIGKNVVQTVKTDTFITTSATYVDVTGVSVTITPTSATSKILVVVNGLTGNSGNSANVFRLRRDSTDIALGVGGTSQETQRIYPGAANLTSAIAISFIDSPSTTSATVYKLTMKVSGDTGYVGRLSGYDERSITSITAVEVAA